MVAIGRTSNAFFFDGVSDSILIPQGNFTSVGPALIAKTNLHLSLEQLIHPVRQNSLFM